MMIYPGSYFFLVWWFGSVYLHMKQHTYRHFEFLKCLVHQGWNGRLAVAYLHLPSMPEVVAYCVALQTLSVVLAIKGVLHLFCLYIFLLLLCGPSLEFCNFLVLTLSQNQNDKSCIYLCCFWPKTIVTTCVKHTISDQVDMILIRSQT